MKIVRVNSEQLDFPILMEQTVEPFCKRFGLRSPRISVGYINHTNSSGRAWPMGNRMRITVGRDMRDAEHILLHELTHLISDHTHGKMFYRSLKRVIRWAGVDAAYSESRESRYKPRNSRTMITRRRKNEGT